MKGARKMVSNNKGYSCYQDISHNRIIIGLPQTWKTIGDTMSAITARKYELTPYEESTLLAVVQALYEREIVTCD